MFEPENRFISSCAKKLRNNEPVSLSEGMQRRDLIQVEDVVDIISKRIRLHYLNYYMSLPIGSGENHSIIKILEFMKQEMNSESELLFGAIPSREGELDTLADISWYKDIGYRTRYSFFDGAKKSV